MSEALTYQAHQVGLTFDDGSETDLLFAAPILREFGFGGTFYITTGFIGKRGYLTQPQLRELSELGFEIGCHSMTHAYLTDLDDTNLYREIAEAKSQLEQMISHPVEHFSCPGGRHNQRVSDVARSAGYRTVSTSRIRTNSHSSDLYALGRVAVMRETSRVAFADLCSGRGLMRRDLLAQAREGTKRVLGNSIYDRLRNVVLGHRATR